MKSLPVKINKIIILLIVGCFMSTIQVNGIAYIPIIQIKKIPVTQAVKDIETVAENNIDVYIPYKKVEKTKDVSKKKIVTEETKLKEVKPIQNKFDYTEEDLYWLSVLIHFEAGYDECSDRHQQLVAMVAINRVKNNQFRNSIKDVIAQTDTIKGKVVTQYNPDYILYPPEKILKRYTDNARAALEGRVECPESVVFQSEFEQGSGVYEIFKISHSTTYFCYE